MSGERWGWPRRYRRYPHISAAGRGSPQAAAEGRGRAPYGTVEEGARGGVAAPSTWPPATPTPRPVLCLLEHPPEAPHRGTPVPSILSDPAPGNARPEHLPTTRSGKRPLRARGGGGGPVRGAGARVSEGGHARAGSPACAARPCR